MVLLRALRRGAPAAIGALLLIGMLMVPVPVLASVGPVNDDIANAAVVPGDQACIEGTTVGATPEAGEVSGWSGASVWYRYSPSASGEVVFRTWLRTQKDSTISIFADTDGTLAGLTFIVNNDDYYDLASRVAPTLTALDVYYIRIETYTNSRDETGTFVLEIDGGCPAPTNDDFAAAQGLGSDATGTVADISNLGATAQAGEPALHPLDMTAADFDNDLGGTSLWYRWTAPADASMDLCLAMPDTTWATAVVGVYTGSLGSLNEVAWQKQDGVEACVTFWATLDTTYQIGVGVGWGSSADGMSLTWGPDTTPPTASIALKSGQENPTDVSPADFTVTFSEAVTGFGVEDLDFTGTSSWIEIGTASITGAGPYTVHVPWTSTNSGSLQVHVLAGGVSDLTGNPSDEDSGNAAITIDPVDPTVTGVTATVKGARATVTWAYDDDRNIVSMLCSLDGATAFACEPGWNALVSKGAHSFAITVADGAGNTATGSTSFTVRSGRIKNAL